MVSLLGAPDYTDAMPNDRDTAGFFGTMTTFFCFFSFSVSDVTWVSAFTFVPYACGLPSTWLGYKRFTQEKSDYSSFCITPYSQKSFWHFGKPCALPQLKSANSELRCSENSFKFNLATSWVKMDVAELPQELVITLNLEYCVQAGDHPPWGRPPVLGKCDG